MGAIKGIGSAVRYNQALHSDTLTATYTLSATCAYWQHLSASSEQDVILPGDISAGWAVAILNTGSATLTIKDAEGTSLKELNTKEAVFAICTDSSSSAVSWFFFERTQGDDGSTSGDTGTGSDTITVDFEYGRGTLTFADGGQDGGRVGVFDGSTTYLVLPAERSICNAEQSAISLQFKATETGNAGLISQRLTTAIFPGDYSVELQSGVVSGFKISAPSHWPDGFPESAVVEISNSGKFYWVRSLPGFVSVYSSDGHSASFRINDSDGNQIGRMDLVAKDSPAALPGFELETWSDDTDQGVRFVADDVELFSQPVTLTDWVVVDLERSDATLTLTINGVDTSLATDWIATNSSYFLIGKSSAGYFSGYIDKIIVE